MGLMDKIFNKAVVPNRMIFDDFANNFEVNLNRVRVITDKLKKDNSRIRDMKFAPTYMEELLNENLEQRQKIVELSGSNNFSGPLTYIIDCQKWYALYYMNTNKGKTDKERKLICERLDELFELTIFITIKHFAVDRKEKIEWKDNAFWYNKNTTGKDVVKLVIEIMEINLGLKNAVEHKDNTQVFQMYSKLRDPNIQQIVVENPFPEF
jgi:hypothetical protein